MKVLAAGVLAGVLLMAPARPSGAQPAPAVKNVKIHGYVTAVRSPTDFDIEDYRISRGQSFMLTIENASDGPPFRPENLRVGLELEVKGELNTATGELRAKSITVDMEQFKKVKQTAILSRLPEGMTKTDQGWSGVCFADGQRIRVGPKTQVVLGLTKRQRDEVKRQKDNAPQDVPEFRPLASSDEIALGMVMTYEGRRSPEDGFIEAERIEFLRNDLEKGEKTLRESLKVESSPFDETSRSL